MKAKFSVLLAIVVLWLAMVACKVGGGVGDAVNPAVVSVCANGSKPIMEHSKGMLLCPR
jgi:hypothetical protein